MTSLKKGWLKKPDGPFKSLKPHFFVLYPDRLEYFKAESDAKPIRALPLQGCTVSENPQKIRSLNMAGAHLKKTYLFQADTSEDLVAWITALREAIASAPPMSPSANPPSSPSASSVASSAPNSPMPASAAAAASPSNEEKKKGEEKKDEKKKGEEEGGASADDSSKTKPAEKKEEQGGGGAAKATPKKDDEKNKKVEPAAAAAAAAATVVRIETAPKSTRATNEPFSVSRRQNLKKQKEPKDPMAVETVKKAANGVAAPQHYVDTEFDATDAALFRSGQPTEGSDMLKEGGAKGERKEVKWLRPSEWGGSFKDAPLFAEKMSTASFKRGLLRNGYVVAALSRLCHPSRHRLLCDVIVDDLAPVGCYGVQFWWETKWTTVVVDDRIPCAEIDGVWQPVFLQGGGLLWPHIVEKAWAKLHGSYEATGGGTVGDIEAALHGGMMQQMILVGQERQRKLDEQSWQRLVAVAKQDDGLEERWCLLSCSTPEQVEEKGNPMEDNACAIDRVVEYEGHRMIHIINHTSFVWDGDFCNTSSLWTPSMKTAVEFEESESSFWISYRDFLSLFCFVEGCNAIPPSCVEHASSVAAKWVGGESAGGADEDTFRFNPCFSFRPAAKLVNLTLEQMHDRRAGGALHELQLKVFALGDGVPTLPNLRFSTTFIRRSRSLLLDLEPDTPYIVMACTTRTGVESSCFLSVSTEGPYHLNPLPTPEMTGIEKRLIGALPTVSTCCECTKDASGAAPLEAIKEYNGVRWHAKPACFRCHHCKQSFQHPSRMLHEVVCISSQWFGVCGGCYRDHYSPRCATCSQPLVASDNHSGKYIKVDKDKVHEECYPQWEKDHANKCAWCGEIIAKVEGKFSGGEYNYGAGKTVHSECREAYLFATSDKCSFCKEAIYPTPGKFNGKYKLFEGGVKIHEECEAAWQTSLAPSCDHCKEPLMKSDKYSGRVFTFDEGAKVHFECKDAYIQATSDACVHCREPICEVPGKFSGSFYAMGDKKVHAECLPALKAAKKK